MEKPLKRRSEVTVTALVGCALLTMMGLAAGTGCKSVQGASRQPEGPKAAVFLLFDISGSTSSPAVRQLYARDFQKVVEAIEGHVIVIGDKITYNTMATATFPIASILPPYNPLTVNALDYRKKVKAERDKLVAQGKALIGETRPEKKTDLMNALQLAADKLSGEQCAAAQRKHLVVFSDMIEQSANVDLCTGKLSPEQITAIIDSEQQAGRLPPLKGVKVWITGATVSPDGGLAPERIRAIKSFWLEYFRACGADLSADRYAPALTTFEL